MRLQPGVKQAEAQVPYGANGEPIQVLAPDETTVASAGIAAGNARTALPSGDIMEVACSDDCKFAFGDSSVDATAGTKRILCKGVYVYRIPPGATHFAVTQVGSSTGTVTVARMR